MDMQEDKGNPKPYGPKQRLAGMIGSGLGCAAGLAVCQIIPFKSFWLGLVLVGSSIALGGFLAQKIASK